eukprot:scaffold184843_cov18-Tisochrysis_lutea.AAC.1
MGVGHNSWQSAHMALKLWHNAWYDTWYNMLTSPMSEHWVDFVCTCTLDDDAGDGVPCNAGAPASAACLTRPWRDAQEERTLEAPDTG